MENVLGLIEHYRYFVLLPLAILEGPFVSLIAGFFIHLGYLSFLPVFIFVVIGDIVSDAFYYHIGRIGDEAKLISKYGSKYKIVSENFPRLSKAWSNHGRKTMFFAKMAYGLTIPFLISAGLARVSYKKFLAYTLPPTLFKYSVLIGAGYYLAYSYEFAARYIYYSGLIILSIALLCLLIYKYAGQYLKNEIEGKKESS